MTTPMTESDNALRQSLQALGRVVEKKLPAPGKTLRVKLQQGQVHQGTIMVVFDKGDAVVSRRPTHGEGLDRLRLILAGAEVGQELADPAEGVVGPQLTADEASLLDESGFVAEDGDEIGVLERSRIELELLTRESLTLEQAAKVLGVSTGRIRQRLQPGARTLYGIKVGRTWRVPKFQFDKKGKQLILGIDHVLPRIRMDAHPLAVKTWFTTPHQDLVIGDDEKPVTPVAWLSAGMSVEEVALLSEEI